jgi:hypothetical protein
MPIINITQSNCFKLSATNAVMTIICYTITWKFYIMWWFIIVLMDLVVFLVYIVVAIMSIICWVRNRKKFAHSFVPFGVNVIAALIIALSPSIYRKKSYYKNTIDLRNLRNNNCTGRLYIETYCVYGGGALSTDVDAIYLTDSSNFRKYIGTYDEGDETIITKCKDDSVLTQKISSEASTQEWSSSKILEQQSFSLRNLKSSGLFE